MSYKITEIIDSLGLEGAVNENNKTIANSELIVNLREVREERGERKGKRDRKRRRTRRASPGPILI